MPKVAGRTHGNGCANGTNRSNDSRNPLRKIVASSTSIAYCTAWLSVLANNERVSPSAVAVNNRTASATARSVHEAAIGTPSPITSSARSIPYDPEQPLGETIRELREEMGGLPDELREQAEQVERTSEELTAATQGTEATADSLVALRERLEAASELVSDYAGQTAEVGNLVEEQREVLANSARRARLTVAAFGLVFAVSQFAPLYLGLGLLGRRHSAGG